MAVLVPYRDTPGRMPLLWWTLQRLYGTRRSWSGFLDADVILCTDTTTGEGPWCKAAAVEDGMLSSRFDADIVVVHDADCWSDGLADAVSNVAESLTRRNIPQWAIPHGDVHRLTPAATAEVLAGRDPHPGMPLVPHHDGGHTRPYGGMAGGGIVVLTRDAYEQVPLDPRFLGWGGEDESWGLALTTLLGPPWRGDAPLYHLWHPPEERLNRHVGSAATRALTVRYQYAAKDGPAAMRALVDEARGVTV